MVDREVLATALEDLGARLTEHLAAEEADLLPLAAAHLTPGEWHRVVLGTLMYRGDPEVVADMVSHLPLVPRLLMPRVAPGIHARYARRVHGTPTP
ncbi:hypothetical protein [uncultured Nocardioides sp.]|uniref:hypothetical protein n=1 Tax=uncultured Nocardioides sp. TaxID=198441 RepID=UPI0025F2DCA6|nr:hypothetical protein [uncultured Nocardioides sp.]